MYRCNNCDEVFDDDEADTRSESRGEYWGIPCSEEISCCPRCGSDDLDHADHVCSSCGKLLHGYDYNTIQYEKFCDECFEEIEEESEKEYERVK